MPKKTLRFTDLDRLKAATITEARLRWHKATGQEWRELRWALIVRGPSAYDTEASQIALSLTEALSSARRSSRRREDATSDTHERACFECPRS